MILHPYHMHPTMQMPGESAPGVFELAHQLSDLRATSDKLKKLLIEKGIDTMDRVIEIETSQALAQWSWYAGAYQQHQFALLMLIEIFLHPRRTDAERIWHGLDYVFQTPPMPRVQRAHWLMEYMQRQMEMYQRGRKLRVGKSLQRQMREASLSTESSFTSNSDPRAKTASPSDPASPVTDRAAMTLPSVVTATTIPMPAPGFQPQVLHRREKSGRTRESQNHNVEILEFNDVGCIVASSCSVNQAETRLTSISMS